MYLTCFFCLKLLEEMLDWLFDLLLFSFLSWCWYLVLLFTVLYCKVHPHCLVFTCLVIFLFCSLRFCIFLFLFSFFSFFKYLCVFSLTFHLVPPFACLVCAFRYFFATIITIYLVILENMFLEGSLLLMCDLWSQMLLMLFWMWLVGAFLSCIYRLIVCTAQL